jgi:hypothetical protein
MVSIRTSAGIVLCDNLVAVQVVEASVVSVDVGYGPNPEP